MKTRVLTGSKLEIAEQIAQIEGVVHEVIVLVEDTPVNTDILEEDIFAEMDAYTVSVGNADDSRDSIYTPMEGE